MATDLSGSLSLLSIMNVEIILRTVTVGSHEDDQELRKISESPVYLLMIALPKMLHVLHLELLTTACLCGH